MTRIYFDTEFIEDGKTIDLISIGMVTDNSGDALYLVSSEFDVNRADRWVVDNVIRHVWNEPRFTRAVIRDMVENFVQSVSPEGKPEFWAYYADYDWVALCQLFGRMIDLPPCFPRYAMDLKQLAVSKGNPRLLKQLTPEHHALNDAIWVRDAYHFLTRGHV